MKTLLSILEIQIPQDEQPAYRHEAPPELAQQQEEEEEEEEEEEQEEPIFKRAELKIMLYQPIQTPTATSTI
ncbi:MAG: hypothetical protein LBJ36_06375 [Synergistaceae bacterium]|nr:hypothetical protein [Synergistaceae bacterium]